MTRTCSTGHTKYIHVNIFRSRHTHTHIHTSKITGNESQGQEEAACACPANTTTGLLFTAPNVVKFLSTVTRSSWALPLSYYRASTFLPCRISKPKMNELGTTIVKNQPFQLLWHPFPYLRLKLDHLDSNSIVTTELIALFYAKSANQHSLQSVQPPLWRSLQYFILRLKKILTGCFFYFYFRNLRAPWYFSRNEANNSWVHFCHLITCMFHLRFWWNLHHYFYNVYPTSRPKISLK